MIYIVLKAMSGSNAPHCQYTSSTEFCCFSQLSSDGYVDRFFVNVPFQVFQSLWAVGIDTGYQIPLRKEVTRGKSVAHAGHSKSPLSDMRSSGKRSRNTDIDALEVWALAPSFCVP